MPHGDTKFPDSEVARQLELNRKTLRGGVKKQREPAPDAELTVNERARFAAERRRELRACHWKRVRQGTRRSAAYSAQRPRC